MQNLLQKMSFARPERRDVYASPQCYVLHTFLDPSLHAKSSPFEVLFRRKSRTTLHTLVPRIDSEQSERSDAFFEQRGQILGELRQAIDGGAIDTVASWRVANATIVRSTTGVASKPGDLVLIKKEDSTVHRGNIKSKLEHERGTDA